MSCVNCGEQPRGDVLGSPVCSVHCAHNVIDNDLGDLTTVWSQLINEKRNEGNNSLAMTGYLDGVEDCANELKELINNE